MAVCIALLGPPSVTRDGVPVAFDTRKATALLAHLALAERPRSREALCDLLWPGRDAERARAALRRTLSVLRAGIGAELIDGAGDALALRPLAELDVARFRTLAATGEDASAIAVFRGRLLEGFNLRDSPDFDTWQSAQEAALHRELSAVLGRLVSALTEASEFAAAIPHAQRWLAIDDLHEPAHRALIRLYALCGDRVAALNQYRVCVRALNDALGVGPTEATARLFTEVSEGVLSPPPAPAPRHGTVAPPSELPLVGREAELTTLRGVRPGALIVVEGEAGIGKTRLLGELAGPGALLARCHEAETGLPYAVVIDLLRQAVERDVTAPDQARADAAVLVPGLAAGRRGLPAPLDLAAPGAQARLLDAVAAVLAGAAGVIVVDDVHDADEASLAVLSYVGRRLAGRPLRLALAWRSEAVPPGHALRALARSAVVIRPRRLTRDEVAALTPDPRAWDESEGLPLFVAEYLAAGGEAVQATRGLLEARLAGADAVTRQVAGAAAVLGRGFNLDALRDTSGRGDDEVAGALEDLVSRGMLQEDHDAYAFSHGKLRELIYDDLGLARRRLLHRRAAATGGSSAVVAEHLRRGGEDAAAAERFAAAAAHAAGLLAHAEAAVHLETALALGHPDPAGLQERLGDARTTMGDYPAALAAYEAAAAARPAAALEHKLGAVHLRRGEWAAADARLRAALQDAPLRPRVLADLALVRHRAGDRVGATALAAEAAAAATDLAARAQAHNLLGMLTGDTTELEQSLTMAERLGDAGAQVAALNNLALASNDTERAIELTERALAICADRHRQAALENNLADLHHAAGHPDDAMTHLKRAVAIFAEVGADESTRLPGIWQLVSW